MTRETARSAVLFLTVATGAAFAVVAWFVSRGATEAWDRALLLSMRTPGNPDDPLGPAWFEEMLAEITALGGYTILVIATFLVVGALWVSGRGREVWFLLAALAGGALVSSGLKALFERPRPDVAEHLDRTFTSSFPSAHAMVATLAYLTLALLVVRLVRHRPLRRFVLLGALALALMIGASRVYLGVHWPSDVVAGWLAGTCWAGLCWLAADAWSRSFSLPGTIGDARI